MRIDLLRTFVARLTGVRFEALEAVGTPEVSAAARRVLDLSRELDERAAEVRATARASDLPRPLHSRLSDSLRKRRALSAELTALSWTERYRGALAAFQDARGELEALAAAAEPEASKRLLRQCLDELPDFLAIESEAAYDALQRRATQEETGEVRKRAKLDRTLALYLQRVCAKNDTLSRFGPISWGRLTDTTKGMTVRPVAGISQRLVQAERWVILSIINAMNRDERVRPELCPRLHPCGIFEGATFVRHDTGVEHSLDEAQLALLRACDGTRPAHTLDHAGLAALAADGIILWEVEPVAWDATPLATLEADVARWRPGEARSSWSAEIDELRDLVARFAVEHGARARLDLNRRAHEFARRHGDVRPDSVGRLYAGTNPFTEDCIRETGLEIGEAAARTLLTEIEPWVGLFQDTFSFAASSVFEPVARLAREAPRRHGHLSVAAFLPFCSQRGVDFVRGGLGPLVVPIFRTVRDEFVAALAAKPIASEWQLSAESCAFLRRNHSFPAVRELSWASADLQVAAASAEAAERGELTWIVGELHEASAISWTGASVCPDPAALKRALAGFGGDRPLLIHQRAGFLAPVPVSPEPLIDAIDHRFLTSSRVKPRWKHVPPAATRVVIDEENRDVRVEDLDGNDLGSLTRNLDLYFGFHPFVPLTLEPFTPRLKLGRAIVQRRTWLLGAEEIAVPDHCRSLSETILAIERLRADRDLPRWIFVHPTHQALAAATSFGRHKDVKPMCIDLESIVFLEVFAQRLAKYGSLIATEMLPTPEQLPWQEQGGRFCFELRTVLVSRDAFCPRSPSSGSLTCRPAGDGATCERCQPAAEDHDDPSEHA